MGATVLSTAADLYAQSQDRLAAQRGAKTAQAERARAIADANRAAAQMRADVTAFSTGQPPVWVVPALLLGGGALAIFYFIRNRTTRRR